MSNLTIYEGNNFDVMQRVAKALAASGYFETDIAKAITKVMAGQELGLPPFASMSGIHVISGKPVLGANLIASLIKSHPRYNYRVKQMDEKAVVITFFENGEEIGTSSFTIEEARKAGSKNLDKFPRNMLFARAISNGARWYCPDIFGGSPAYTHEEMGLQVDEDGYIDGEIVEQSPAQATPAPAPTVLHVYGDGEIAKDAAVPSFLEYKAANLGEVPHSVAELRAWYKAQNASQATTPPPAPEHGTAGDVDGVAGETGRGYYAQLIGKTSPNVGDVIAALSGDKVTTPPIALGIIEQVYATLKPTPATKITAELAAEMYDKVVDQLAQSVA